MQLGDRIQILREQKNMTQKDFANILGVSRPAITKYENNERMPDPLTLVKIADYFNVTVDYLLCRDAQITSIQRKSLIYDKLVTVLISVGLLHENSEITDATLDHVLSVCKVAADKIIKEK